MKNGRHAINTKKTASGRKRSVSFIVALVLLMTLAIGGTVAYLTVETSKVENSFTAAGAPTPSIEETFSEGGTVKSNVKVKLDTNGSGAYYVRAAIVFSLQDDSGNTVAKVPAAGTDYNITMGSGWTLGSDGYYYYNGTVTPGGSTSNLIESCTTLNSEYKLVVDIVAQTIQAVPGEAAKNEWGYEPSVK